MECGNWVALHTKLEKYHPMSGWGSKCQCRIKVQGSFEKRCSPHVTLHPFNSTWIQILGGLGQWVGECVSSSFGYRQSVNEIVTKTDDPALANDFWLKSHIFCLTSTMISFLARSNSNSVDIQQRSAVSRTWSHSLGWILFRFFWERGRLCFLITSPLRCQCRIAERQDKGWRAFCGLLTVQGTVTSLPDDA